MVTRYPFIVMLFVLAASWQAAVSIHVVRKLLHSGVEAARPIYLSTATDRIAAIDEAGKQAGLRPGDELMAIQDQPYRGESQVSAILSSMRPGQRLMLRIRHPGQTQDVTMAIPVEPSEKAGPLAWIVQTCIFVLTPAFCLLLGFGVLAVRPRDPLAWLLLMLMLSFAHMSTGEAAYHAAWELPAGLRPIAIGYHAFFASTWATWILLFGVYFPERLPLDRKLPWLKWLLILPVLAAAVAQVLATIADSENITAISSFRALLDPTYQIGFYAGMISISGFFMCLGVKQGTASTADAKRRLKLLQWGASVALTPLFFVAVYGIIFGWNNIPEYFYVPGILLLAVFPLTLAYVIVVQRALDVRVVVRQGLQYTLATRGVRILQALAAIAVIWGAMALAEDPTTRRPQKLMVIGLSTIFVIRLRQGGSWLSKWVDRRFFREAYSAEKILSELSDKVRTMVETGPLLETVAHQIADSLHVNHVAMLVKSNGHYQPAYAIGYSADPLVTFGEKAGPIEQLKRNRELLKIYPDDPESWIYRDAAITGDDRKKLQELDSQLLLPLAVKDKLLGLISLGPKRSEEPYSKTDVQLLESLATQTGLALENSYLTQAIASEVAHRERLNRELEIAREVQERLFPQSYPQVSGLDYAGHCRPALGVGGDYYDFLELPGGVCGVAIGDVSGKGVPAALLMACLQATLRGQTISGPTDLAGLMTNMNRLIFNATPSNRYATFFYAQYQPDSRKLTYVNAGHNPPMVFRGSEVIRLEEGGPIVGLFRPAEYTQASLHLECGDILVLFTDGISESMNANDDEWGEEALIETVQKKCKGFNASQILDRLMQEAEAFAAGAPQHDDMTVVVLRVV
jgi:phosphoserine phosphatase RsbU/P